MHTYHGIIFHGNATFDAKFHLMLIRLMQKKLLVSFGKNSGVVEKSISIPHTCLEFVSWFHKKASETCKFKRTHIKLVHKVEKNVQNPLSSSNFRYFLFIFKSKVKCLVYQFSLWVKSEWLWGPVKIAKRFHYFSFFKTNILLRFCPNIKDSLKVVFLKLLK